MYRNYGYSEEKKANAVVNLSAIEHNFNYFKSKLNNKSRLMAVVKADAYGHGSIDTAKALEKAGADAFAVANIDEAVELRKSGVAGLILVLGYTLPELFGQLCRYDISQTCASYDYLAQMDEYCSMTGNTLKLHLKLNTGMNRTGFFTEGIFTDELEKAAQLLKSSKLIEKEGVFSHFADSDEPDSTFTRLQAERFIECVNELENRGISFRYKHICNTMGVVNFPEYHFDMVRVGIGLHGYTTHRIPELIPSMEYSASVIAVNKIAKGSFVSYGLDYIAPDDRTIAVVCCGYADGLKRGLSNKGFFLCHGEKCPIVGKVCMDMTMIDVSAIADKVKVGDMVKLFGHQGDSFVGADEVAELADTITYEILCGVGNRFKRVYVR